MSLRYWAGSCLLLLTRASRRVLRPLTRLASLPERFAVIVWTPVEIDRYSRAGWDSWEEVGRYTALDDDWCDDTEKSLVEKYFNNGGDVLNLACGAGREARLLAARGSRVTACDWSPRMIAAAQSKPQTANPPIRFEVADLYDLQYPDNSFDYALVTNIAYSYFFPRRRRIHLLKQVYSLLRPDGVFVVAFSVAPQRSRGDGKSRRDLLTRLSQYPPFNSEYEQGDRLVAGSFNRLFQPEELRGEFEEATS